MPDIQPSAICGAQLYTRLLKRAGGNLLDIVSARSEPGLQVALYGSPPYDLQVPSMDVARLSINLLPSPVIGAYGDDPARDYAGRRYSMFLAPANVTARWQKLQHSRHINIYFNSDSLATGEGAARGSRFGDQPLLHVRQACVKPWIDALEASMACDVPFAEDTSVGLARLILAALARPDRGAALRLSAQAMATVNDYVRAHLDGRIRVRDLAATVGLSENRFALAFAATSGRTPHRFILECRLARAQELLCQGRMLLADVATACGFASQQHLTTVMRRCLGTTPGRFRRSRGAS